MCTGMTKEDRLIAEIRRLIELYSGLARQWAPYARVNGYLVAKDIVTDLSQLLRKVGEDG